jgi:hypothetical protein
MGDLSDFERGQFVGKRLVGSSIIKTATLLSVLGAKGSKVMSEYTTSWEDNISEEKHWAKINTDKKRSSYIEKDFSRNDRITAAQVTADLNIHLEKPVRCELHKSNIHCRSAIAKPLTTESNAHMHKR